MDENLIDKLLTEKEEKVIADCVKCGKEIEITPGQYTEEKIKTLNFMCSDCINNAIVENESRLEKEIIAKLEIDPKGKYTTTEAAKKLGISSRKVLRKIKKGEIKTVTRVKGKSIPRYKISGEEILDYVKTRYKENTRFHTSSY